MAIGDTVNAGLMRVDFSPIARAGQAQARANQAFGNAIGGVIDKFYQKKKDKQEREEREQAYLKMGLSDEEAKAASRDKDLAGQFINKINADRNYDLQVNKFKQAGELRDVQMQQIEQNMAAKEKADQLAGEEQEKTKNFLNFLGQPGPNQIDPSGPDRNSVLRNIRAGKGATPPARMIPGPSPAEQSVISPQAKKFISDSILQNQPMDKVLPMAKQIDAQIAQSQPKAPDPFKVREELRKTTEFEQGQDAITFTPDRNSILLGDTAYGISGKFGNETEVIKLKSVDIPNYSNMNTVMNQLISLGEKRKTTKFMSNADKTLAASLSRQLQGLLREEILGPGTVTDPERAILEQIVQNPTTWMDTAGNTQSKIDSLKGIRKNAFNKLKTRLTGLGLDVAEISQGDASSPSKSSVDFDQETSSGLGYTEINLDQL